MKISINSTKTQYEQDKLMEKFEAKEAEVKGKNGS